MKENQFLKRRLIKNSGFKLKELTKRSIVAAFGIPVIVLLIYLGSYYFTVAVTFLSTVTLWEFYKIVEKKGAKPNKFWGLTFNIVLTLSSYFLFSNQHYNEILFAESLIFIVGALSLQLISKNHNAIMNISATIGGSAYITLFFICLIAVREYDYFGYIYYGQPPAFDSMILVYSFIVSVWICDTAAYLFGRKFGRHKLMPHVSPKKSWEGAVAGFFGSVVTMVLINYFTDNLDFAHSLMIGIIVGIGGQIGDLAESQLKRDAGVKDSSGILPGHGGFLDRFDSILFVSPIILVYLVIFI